MKQEIRDAITDHLNELNEYISNFEKRYVDLQKRIGIYELEKGRVNEIDYSDIFNFRFHLANEIHKLKDKMGKIIDSTIQLYVKF